MKKAMTLGISALLVSTSCEPQRLLTGGSIFGGSSAYAIVDTQLFKNNMEFINDLCINEYGMDPQDLRRVEDLATAVDQGSDMWFENPLPQSPRLYCADDEDIQYNYNKTAFAVVKILELYLKNNEIKDINDITALLTFAGKMRKIMHNNAILSYGRSQFGQLVPQDKVFPNIDNIKIDTPKKQAQFRQTRPLSEDVSCSADGSSFEAYHSRETFNSQEGLELFKDLRNASLTDPSSLTPEKILGFIYDMSCSSTYCRGQGAITMFFARAFAELAGFRLNLVGDWTVNRSYCKNGFSCEVIALLADSKESYCRDNIGNISLVKQV
jgi:hypothetical protein